MSSSPLSGRIVQSQRVGLPDAAPPDDNDNKTPLDPAVVDEAVDWYVRSASGMQTEQERADFNRWHAARPEHARAWQRMQAMGSHIQSGARGVSTEVARDALVRTAAPPPRRRALKTAVWIGAGGTTAWLVRQHMPWRGALDGALADLRTATGERRKVQLADGTQLLLNTATAVDIRFTERERRVVLRRGEVLVATARDAGGRPFVLATPEGTLAPVGTRFAVRRDEVSDPADGKTRLAVSQGAVDVRTASQTDAPPTRVHAGQQLQFTVHGIDAPAALQETALSWADGSLAAEGMRLDHFIAELDRYRPGRLRCAPEVAGLRITGVWPLDGDDPTERILASLERRLPVKVVHRTRYWVTVQAR